ncbi:MAG: hypothetical protein MJZ16_04325, partial [Bacteroidales bacterium]|nr:hypothetical protein [Bacteroidales bacterium]
PGDRHFARYIVPKIGISLVEISFPQSIVGYNPDYSYIVMDTETGKLTDVESSSISFHITATGVK